MNLLWFFSLVPSLSQAKMTQVRTAARKVKMLSTEQEAILKDNKSKNPIKNNLQNAKYCANIELPHLKLTELVCSINTVIIKVLTSGVTEFGCYSGTTYCSCFLAMLRIFMMSTAILLEEFELCMSVRKVINTRQLSILWCVMVEE